MSRSSYRLSGQVVPSRYDLELELDPARSLRYRGRVRIAVRLARATQVLELHAVELALRSASVLVNGVAQRARIEPLPEQERVRLCVDQRLAAGEAVIELSFSGTLRKDLRGLYLARRGALKLAVTQLEAADARRFFPCFDEPAFKARFALSVTTAAAHTVIANAKAARRTRLPDGRVRTVFAPTPLISTYLVALAVGPLEASRTVRAGQTPIRVLHVPGQAQLTGFALQAARECLLALERWFGIPYPYGKLDLVAVPQFEMGAMENVGAVFFRETLLLVDEERASLAERKRAIEVICHELAHMWYGNLVTMAWWDDLWLNEAFATWMAFEIVDRIHPELRMWNDFGHARNSAFELDALASTHPIYAKVRTPEEASQSFDLITYEKGAAVIRMLERYLGPERFRRGVRDYVRRHREGNAEARDLWRALSRYAGAAVDEVVRPWIERPGFPLVRVQGSERGGRQQLVLTQSRFRAGGEAGRRASGRVSARGAAPWPVPVVLATTAAGKRRERRHLLSETTLRVTLARGERLLYPNADEGGFYRPLPDAALLRSIAAQPARLRSSERLGLVGHVWAAVQAGHARVDELLELALALHDEPDADVLAALSAVLREIVDQLAPHAGPDAPVRLRARLAEAFAPALRRLPRRPARGEDDDTRRRRGELLALVAVVAEQPAAVRDARALGQRYLRAARGVDPNLVPAALVTLARTADAKVHRQLLLASQRATTPQERRRLRIALAEHRDPRCVAQALLACLDDRIPVDDVALVLARMLHNPHAQQAAWRFLRSRFGALRERIPPLLMSRVIDALPALSSDAARRQAKAFFRAHPVATATRALAQADERFALDARLRARAAPELARWLASR
jgi:puromycin-sensitive aminopeptidase